MDPATGTVSGAVSCSGTFTGRIGAAANTTNGAPTQDGISVTTTSGSSVGLNTTNFGPDTATILLRDHANISIGTNATVSAPSSGAVNVNNQAIFINDDGIIDIGAGATVINYSARNSGGVPPINAGHNTIEFNSRNTITIGVGATVNAAGTSAASEAINPTGFGNLIKNYGTLTSATGAAVWF